MDRLVLTICLSLFLCGSAHAGDKNGREKYKRATAHFSLGKFQQAAREYEEIYLEHPDQNVLLYNIGQAHRLAGDAEKALFSYRRYLATVPKAANRAEVEERVKDLERLSKDVRKNQETPPNDPAPVSEPPKPEPVVVAAAPAPVSAPRDDRPTPVYKKWWLWTIVGGVAVAGLAVGLGVGLTRPAPFMQDFPDFGPGSTSGLTVRF